MDHSELMGGLREGWEKFMGWNPSVLDAVNVALGCYLSPQLPGDQSPCWNMISAPSGVGKSTILKSLKWPSGTGKDDPPLLPQSIGLNHLTEHGLVSHFKDDKTGESDFGLLDRLHHDVPPVGTKVLITSDFSTLSSKRKEQLAKVMADMRQAFDGEYESHGGADGHKRRNFGRFGWIAAGTGEIEDFFVANQVMGQRWTLYRMFRRPPTYEEYEELADRVAKARPGAKNSQAKVVAVLTKAIIESTTQKITALVKDGWETCDRTEAEYHVFKKLATLCTFTRQVHGAEEGPPRLVEQFRAFGDCHALLNGRTAWTDRELFLIRRLCQDSPRRASMSMLNALYRGDPSASVNLMLPEEVRKGAKLGSGMSQEVERQLQHWARLGFIRQEGDRYALSSNRAADIKMSGFLEGYNV